MRKRALVLAAAMVLVAPLALASPASAIAGRVRVVGPATPMDSTPIKASDAACPSGTRVVGGGGWAFDNDAGKVHLTLLQPVAGSPDRYSVQAEAEPGFTGTWWLQAYAICANVPAGYQIIASAPTASASNTFVTQFVDCPSGKKLLGIGARILGGNREVGLQRTSADSGITRSLSTAREDANGYSGNWTLTAYGVCATTVAGAGLASTLNSGSTAIISCSSGTVHSVGGGGPFFDAGPVFLMKLFPSSVASKVEVAMSGTPSHGVTEADALCWP